jgi:hypothetical protein
MKKSKRLLPPWADSLPLATNGRKGEGGGVRRLRRRGEEGGGGGERERESERERERARTRERERERARERERERERDCLLSEAEEGRGYKRYTKGHLHGECNQKCGARGSLVGSKDRQQVLVRTLHLLRGTVNKKNQDGCLTCCVQ